MRAQTGTCRDAPAHGGKGAERIPMNVSSLALALALELPWVLTRLSLVALLDILVVAVIFYWLLTVAAGTRAMPLLRGIGILLGFIAVLGSVLDLTALRRLISYAVPALLVSLPVIFQPELRRALEQLGQTRTWLNLPFAHSGDEEIEHTIDEIVRAVTQLARQRTGALIVIERETGLQDYADRATPLHADLTRQLLVQTFIPNSPLHDGAVIIRGNQIVAAGVILPLTEEQLNSSLGTRHRAAVGISEVSDAIAVVSSEETGTISVAIGGNLTRNMTHDLLKATLRAYLRVGRRATDDAPAPAPPATLPASKPAEPPATVKTEREPAPPAVPTNESDNPPLPSPKVTTNSTGATNGVSASAGQISQPAANPPDVHTPQPSQTPASPTPTPQVKEGAGRDGERTAAD